MKIVVTFLIGVFVINTQAQVVFWTEDFDSDAPSSGTRAAINHTDQINGSNATVCSAGNYFFRINTADDAPAGVSTTMSGFTGFYWRGEDLDACITNPDVINFTGIDVTGLSNFRFTGSFAATPSNLWDIADGDEIAIEYSFDGGVFKKGMSFIADNAGSLRQDTDLDGTADGAVLDATLSPFSFFFNETGNELSLSVVVSADDGSEEFGFDNFTLERDAFIPVELISFKGKVSGKAIHLSWTTASEIDNKVFEIERSTNTKQWQRIASVEGNGNSLIPQHYQFIDETPVVGINYYRLKQIDFSGLFEYSQVIQIESNHPSKNVIKIYPNPNQSRKLYIRSLSDQTSDRQIEIYNMNGQLLYTQHQLAQKDQSDILELKNWSSGIYIIKIRQGAMLQIERLVVE
ncbi:MAG: T9SS type A sorting domain-containing protein [Bacteroidota bacterium]